MKKLFTLLVVIGVVLCTNAQVTTNPSFITQTYSNTFEVVFDASKGAGGMKGAETCFAHTGVILKGGTQWSHASTWGDNSDKYKLESIGQDLWKLTITDGIASYYGLKEGEIPEKLMFVFRTKDNSPQSEDLEYVLYEDGKQGVSIKGVEDGGAYYTGSQLNINVETILTADISLSINGEEVKSVAQSSKLDYSLNLENAGTYNANVTVITGGEKTDKSVTFYCIKPTEDRPLPDGVKEGINYLGNGEVTLVLRAPLSEDVFILGDFNGWVLNEDYHAYRANVLLEDEKNDSIDTKTDKTTRFFWRTFKVDDPKKKYAYQYYVDSKVKISDPYTKVVLDPWNDNSIRVSKQPNLPKLADIKGLGYDGVVSVLELEDDDPYQWSQEGLDFKIENPKDLMIYELHIRDFSPKKSLQAVIDSLDYLKKLGINAIELMPVTEFDGNDSWGYNPNHFFAYDKAYGARNVYKQFIDICHQNGIAVILDMVFNHATGIFPFAKLYWGGSAPTADNPWLNQEAKHPANVFNDFNHEYVGTRKYFKEVLKYWLEEYNVDGFRMDLSKGFTQKKTNNYDAWAKYDKQRVSILREYYDAVHNTDENAVFILEHLAEFDEDKDLSKCGMLPWRNMSNAYQQSAMGWPSDSRFVDSDNGKEGGMFTDGWIGYGESHDEERCFYKAKAYGNGNLKSDSISRLARVPLNVAFEMLIPGPKMMWQFGELGYDFSINWCTDGKIKDDCRTYQKYSPWSTNLNWQNDILRMNAYRECCKVLNLRNKYPQVFRKENFKSENCAATDFTKPRRMTFTYDDIEDPNNSVVIMVIGNFDASSAMMVPGNFPNAGTWYDCLNDTQFEVKRLNKTISVQPGELKIFSSRKLEMPVEIEEEMSDNGAIIVYPTEVEDFVYAKSMDDIKLMEVCSLGGTPVVSAQNTDKMDLSNLQSGNYILLVSTEYNTNVVRIIKK